MNNHIFKISRVMTRRSQPRPTLPNFYPPLFQWLLALVFVLLIACSTAFSQQPQAQSGQEIYPVNAKYVQGLGPGYWPTVGSGLSLNLAPGTAVCSNQVHTYAGGTLTLAPSTTNYVYLNPANSCAPAANTTGFTTGAIPIATVATGATAISAVTDVRTMFVSGGATAGGTVTSVGMSGDGIIFSPTVSGSPITTSGTLAPQLLTQSANNLLAGPGSGAAATPTFRALVPADLPATISSNTTGNAATASAFAAIPTQCGANAWATGITANGNANCSQPTFGVTSISGDGNLFTNSNSTGAVTLTPGSFSAHYFWGNNTASAATAAKSLIGSSDTSVNWYGAGGGSSQAQTITLTPPVTALTAGLTVRWKPAAANTGSGPTLSVNGLTAAAITKCGTNGLVANDLTTATVATAVYDGTEFQLLNPMAAGCGGGGNLGTSGTPAQYQVGVFASGSTIGGIAPGATSGVPIVSQGSSSNPIFGTASIAGGGTGQTTASAAFNALSPLTTEGDLPYYHSSSNARLAVGSNGQCLTSNGTDPVWGSCSTGSGTVTSVGLSMPSLFSVSGSPVTGAGTLTASLATQSAHLFLAGPTSGSAAAPTFRSLIGADLPAPAASALGGIESITCTSGQFLDEVSTAGVPICGIPSGGSSSGLGNGTSVIDASLQAGANWGAKVNAAITLCSVGACIIDTRGLAGAQSMSANVTFGSHVAPTVILLADSLVLTRTGGAQFIMGDAGVLQGPSSGRYFAEIQSTSTTDTSAAIVFNQAGYGYSRVSNVSIVNYGTGPCINGGSMDYSVIEGNVMSCTTGITFNGYYNRISGNFFGSNGQGVMWAGILLLGADTANSDEIFNNVYMGFGGTGAVVTGGGTTFGGYADNFEGKEDCENLALCYWIQGNAIVLDSPYIENVGFNTYGGPYSSPIQWAANTLVGIGYTVNDSNGNGEMCITAGTTGTSAPAWGSTSGAVTNDGTAQWETMQKNSVNGMAPGIVLAAGAGTNVVKGATGQNPTVLDLDYALNGNITNTIDTSGNRAWGESGTPPYSLTAQPLYGLLLGNYNQDPSAAFVSLNFSNHSNSNGNTAYWGAQLDVPAGASDCTQLGLCGHQSLHVSSILPASGIYDYGPVSVNPLPTPAPPTLTVVGTTGSTSLTYYVVAHCGGGVTLPSGAATVTNANANLSSANYVLINVPTSFASGYTNSENDVYSMCRWDILKGNTSTVLASAQLLASGQFQDTGGTTSAYTLPTRNTTGDANFAGTLTTSMNVLDDASGDITAASKVTAQQFCVGSSCVSSLTSNPLTSEGDMIYNHASAPARLAIGGSNQVLMGGIDPTWANLGTLIDANGNATIKSVATASAVDQISVTDAAAGNPATVGIAATGSDTNINLSLTAKGSGNIYANSCFYPSGSSSNALCSNGNNLQLKGTSGYPIQLANSSLALPLAVVSYSTAPALNLGTANVLQFACTTAGAAISPTLSNINKGTMFTVIFVQNGTTACTWNWPSSIHGAPAVSTTLSSINTFHFVTSNNGTDSYYLGGAQGMTGGTP